MDYNNKQRNRIAVMFAMASILVLSSLTATSTGLMGSSSLFATAAATSTADDNAPVVATQHIPNNSNNLVSIETLSVTAKAMKTMPASNVQVQIVGEDGKVKGSTKLASSLFSLTTYKTITAKFDPPVKVKGNFEVVFRGNGLTVLIVRESGQIIVPGYVTIPDRANDKQLDVYFTINGKAVATALANAANGSSDNNSSSGGSSNTNNGNATISFVAKRSEDKKTEITGMHFTVFKGLEKVGEGFSGVVPVKVKAGTTYTVVATLGYQQIQFVQWADTGSTSSVRSATISKDTTLTAYYSGAPESTPSNNNSGNTNSTNNNSNQGTPTAGTNQVAVNSQLLDGTSLPGMAVELREANTGNIIENKFTPTTLDMQPGIEYKVIMYPFQDLYFRHWTDGGLHRYHLVDTAHNSGTTLTAQYERVPASQAAHLIINAQTSDGQTIGGTTGSEAQQNLNAQPGLEVLVAQPNSSTPYTAGFTGGSEIAQGFFFQKGQTYTVTIEEFAPYKFSHWSDGSTAATRTVTLNGDTTLTAIFDKVA